ncbi:MAG: Gfo/Idh/MocA family protein [Oligoflexales bacterium]
MKPFKTGLVGLGNMGKYHLQSLQQDADFNVVAAVDPDEARLAPVRETAKVFRDYKELADLDLDCVVVAAPTQTHYTIAKFFLDRGINVLVEKPAATTVPESQDLVATAKKKGVKLCVGHVERCNPVVKIAKKIISEGVIGRPLHSHSMRVGHYPGSVHASNNVIIDLAVHELDVLATMFGPVQLRSTYGRKVRHQDICDMGEIFAVTESGTSALMHVNWLSPFKQRKMRVMGSGGVMELDYMHQECEVFAPQLPKMTFPDADVSAVQDPKLGDKLFIKCHRQHPIYNQLQQFSAYLSGNEHNLCAMDDIVDSIRVLEHAQKFLEIGK